MTALVARTPQQAAMDLAPTTWTQMKEQAAMLVRSNFLPESVKTPEQAMAIMLKGRELGVPPMQAFAQISVIKGKPTIGAELMLALIFRECPKAKIEYKRYEIDGCTIVATRPGHAPATFTFERSDAEAAQLLGKDNWRKFPRAMYRSRCISEMARSLFPDCIMGCSYTPEEIDPDLRMEEDGTIDVTPVKEAPKPAAAKERPPRPKPVGAVADVPFEGPPATMAAPPETKSEEKAPGGFDPKIPTHIIAISNVLKSRGFEQKDWPRILKALTGRPSTDLDTVIKEVEAAVAAENAAAEEAQA